MGQSDCCNRIVEFANSFCPNGKIPKDWNLSADHVTMMHANSYFSSPATVKLWEELSNNVGTLVNVLPVSLLVNERCIAMKVSLTTTGKGTVLDKYVISNVPHITIACAPGVKSFETATEIQNAANLVDISSEEPFSAIMSLIE